MKYPKARGKMKARITAVGDGNATGIIECTEEEFKIIDKALDCIGDEIMESYSPSVYIERIPNANNDKETKND